MVERTLLEIVRSGRRVKTRELFAAMRAEGFVVEPTSKSTHFKVRVPNGVVIIATKRDEILPVYVSRIAWALGLRDGGGDA